MVSFLRTSDGSVALTAGAHGCLCFLFDLVSFPSGLRDEIMDLRMQYDSQHMQFDD
jgi:hypothetical protein